MPQQVDERARELLSYIDAGPSPWHVVETTRRMLEDYGFRQLGERDTWQPAAGDGCYIIRDGSSIVAFVAGSESPADAGFRLIGAHTDSPGLRLKPRPALEAEGMLKLGVDVYGGPILATFVDRDLDLAGRVFLAPESGSEPVPRLLRFGRPVVKLPGLAIHMDREVNNTGMVLDKQKHLPLLAGLIPPGQDPHRAFLEALAAELVCDPDRILSFELAAADCQPAAFGGLGNEFISSPRLDNLASCHAALLAVCAAKADPGRHTRVIALFDHEEVGSRSSRGADGSFLRDVLQRLCQGPEDGADGFARAIAGSWLLSVDMAHAFHPNRPDVHEPRHHVRLNGGPVIKQNTNRRYATDACGVAWFSTLCAEAGVPVQQYVHHGNLPCGSTIGPLAESGLGVRTVDVGNPMLGMHSIRETAGVQDHAALIRALGHFLTRA